MRPNKKNMRYKEIFTCFSGMDMLKSFQIKGSSLRETVADTRHHGHFKNEIPGVVRQSDFVI
ncbi:hypothetical protein KGMB03357_10650 [Anaerotignum faecicola]|uniref:Uncharacterized protein n=1 Tax=Anaerotignum faecicola TaxID=2358141 RepID=A0A401LD92_9FIRM|nr:hypothetical protein KGMB03357_10650 [Anaerotignum faecicola]